MSYEYDIFLSDSRGGAKTWVQEAFGKMLAEHYPGQCGIRSARALFIDEGAERGGQDKKERLTWALHHSRVMVAIGTVDYPSRPWCLAEWDSMRARETAHNLGVEGRPGLVYPISLVDLEARPRLPGDPLWDDFSRFAHIRDHRSRSIRCEELHEEVVKLCRSLRSWMDQAPPWRQDFPIIDTDPQPSASIPNPSSL